MLRSNENVKELTDSIIVSWLDYLGYDVRGKKLPSNRVGFEVHGNNIDSAIEDFYKNPKVPILNFCSSYKKIRSMIFNLKGTT